MQDTNTYITEEGALPFLQLETNLRLDMLEDGRIGENARALGDSVLACVDTLEAGERGELREALTLARPLLGRFNFENDDLPMLLNHLSRGLTRAARRLFYVCTEHCHPNFAWVGVSGLDVAGEVLASDV